MRGAVPGATATIVEGVNSPAMIRPTRKATTVESATVTKVKRFDMVFALTATIPDARVASR
jgi:hypothetical protein